MGNYNPQAPVLLGQQWAPIRNVDATFAPQEATVETGHAFTSTVPETITQAKFYVNELPANPNQFQTVQANIYPYGSEALSGPIQQVIIPCTNGGVTGTGLTIVGGTVSIALRKPGDGLGIQAVYAAGVPVQLAMFFAANQFPQLQGKRILNVSMEYSGYVQDTGQSPSTFVNPLLTTNLTNVLIASDFLGNSVGYAPEYHANTGALNALASVEDPDTGTVTSNQEYGVINLGDVSPLVAGGVPSILNFSNWRYPELQRFEASNANRVAVYVTMIVPATPASATPNGVKILLEYAALRVTYCEEQRVIAGTGFFGFSMGTNQITMRDINTALVNPVLPAGQYSLTFGAVSPGDATVRVDAPFPTVNAVRQLYQISSHPGVEVDIPFPLDDHIGGVFSRQLINVLPQLSLHASGGPSVTTITEPHVYGRQVAAQVYGANVAQQTIYDDIVGVATPYPQVRFYARRFGATTVPLTLSTASAPISGSTASISVSDFDALPEIVDGWREVTLRFGTVPSMGAITPDPVWQWSAAGELAGNRWEILGACAPSIGSNNFTPASTTLTNATYQPPAGTATSLTWMPQGCGSPYVTGATADANSDATLIFSQDPPTITGLAISQLTQAVTGIGLNCGSLPCCIPSGIGYNRLTWSAASIAASGFGSYELQRFDQITATFQTIMLTTSAGAATGTVAFNDYEARVGLPSVYRIRVNNLYNFSGAWSSQVSGAPPTPGITGGCTDMTGALIFSTNGAQQGNANAAYIMNWDADLPEETFSFAEAGQVEFQRFYGRDGSVAFHGTERGLESFSRLLLIQGGAISPSVVGAASMANTALLRNLAWGNYPYICVRDDQGNRWYATVQVPAVNIRNVRQSYMASVTITETTQTPYAVTGS